VKRSRMILDVTLVAVLGVAVLGATLALAQRSGDLAFFDPLIDIKYLLDERYVESLDEEALQRGAIEGMLDVLDDPYTVYVPGADRDEFRKDLTGEYVGIGAQILMEDGWLTIVTPLEGSPAYRAGLMADDRVVEIEGESTFGKTADECVELLAGEEGTPVTITVERDGERFEMTIVRDQIKTRSVKGFHRDPTDPERWQFLVDPARRVAYLRLTQFTPGASAEVRAALQSVLDDGPVGGVILDVRDNPGGVLADAVAIVDMFIDEGVIVTTRGRSFEEEVRRATESTLVPDAPMLVMINDSSASASEVVAGALADHDRAIVLGARSFGKGSVQGVIPLPSTSSGAQLKITEQYYYLPSGRLIHRRPESAVWGVDPTPGYYVSTTDEQEIEMFRARQEQNVLGPGADASEDQAEESWSDPDWIVDKLKDQQLAAAIEAIQARIDTGQWRRTGQEGVQGTEMVAEELRSLRLARERTVRQLERLNERERDLLVAAGDAAEDPTHDLWPDNLDLEGGTLEVVAPDGETVSRLRITGSRLEAWLLDADLEPIEASNGASREQPAAPEGG